jgi:hypothetical protein
MSYAEWRKRRFPRVKSLGGREENVTRAAQRGACR